MISEETLQKYKAQSDEDGWLGGYDADDLIAAYRELSSQMTAKDKQIAELTEALEKILATPEGSFQITSGWGHVECLKIARRALKKPQ